MSSVIGWVGTYDNDLPKVSFTEDRKIAFIERVRKRKYYFTYNNYEYLPYCAPVYEDGKVCVLTKQQFENAMNEAWQDMKGKKILLPMDVITIAPKNNILYEKTKFMEDKTNV